MEVFQPGAVVLQCGEPALLLCPVPARCPALATCPLALAPPLRPPPYPALHHCPSDDPALPPPAVPTPSLACSP